MKVKFENIPLELASKNSFVNWEFTLRKGKMAKVPFTPNGFHASVTDSRTWSNLQSVKEAYERRFDGIGFVFIEDFVGIDIDHCITKDGVFSDLAKEVMAMFPHSYIEKSPSGEGLHILCRGKVKRNGKGTLNKSIEIYSVESSRYFTVTGDVVQQGAVDLQQAGLDLVHERYFELKEKISTPIAKQTVSKPANKPVATPHSGMSALELLYAAEYELEAMADTVGIHWGSVLEKIGSTLCTAKYTKGISHEKKDNNRVTALVDVHRTNKGREYPIVSLINLGHGGIKQVFNGYKWLKSNNMLDKEEYHISRVVTEDVEITQEVADKNSQALEIKMAKFQAAETKFNASSPVASIENTYLSRKGFKNISLDSNFRRGVHPTRGGYIVAKTISVKGELTGFESFYDNKFTEDGVSRDKDFIFKPTIRGRNIETYKKGSFIPLYSKNPTSPIWYLAEGLATGLSVWLATGANVAVCLDAKNIPAVALEMKYEGYTCTIAADNDCGKGSVGNTGISSALESPPEFDITYPIMQDGSSCDFNDLHVATNLDTVREQLKSNIITHEGLLGRMGSKLKYCSDFNFNEKLWGAAYLAAHKVDILEETEQWENALVEAANGRKPAEEVKAAFKKALKIRRNKLDISHRFSTLRNKSNADYADLIKAKLDKGKEILVLDYRGMGAGKTDLMVELVKRNLNRNKQRASEDEVKAYYFQSGGNSETWEQVKNNPLSYELWQSRCDSTKSSGVRTYHTLYTAHRTSLIDSAVNRLDVMHYDKAVPMQAYMGLACCINSIVKHSVNGKYEAVLIDEVRQTFEHIYTGTVEERKDVYGELVDTIKKAKLVVAADADMDQYTFDKMVEICEGKEVLVIDDKGEKLTRNPKRITVVNSHDTNIKSAVEWAKAGNNVWVCTDSIKQARKADKYAKNILIPNDLDEDLATSLIEQMPFSEEEILIVTAENKGDSKQKEFLSNPELYLDSYKCVISTPVISSGISILNPNFKRIFAMFSGVVTPNEMAQMVGRVRKAEEIYASFKTAHKKNRVTELTKAIKGETAKRRRLMEESKIVLDEFDNARLAVICRRNAQLNSYKSEFLFLAQVKGYEISKTEVSEKVDLSHIGKLVQVERIDAILEAEDLNELQYKALSNLTSTTQLQSDAMHKYRVATMSGRKTQDITEEDVELYNNRGMSKVSNYEVAHSADVDKLIEQDLTNLNKGNSSKTTKHMIFKHVLDTLTRLENANKCIDNDAILEIGKYLTQQAYELNAANMGNYFSMGKYAVRKINGFIEQYGYKLTSVKTRKLENVTRAYQLTINQQIADCAARRAANKSANLHNMVDMKEAA